MRDGPYLVVRQRYVELPANCVICNSVASKRVKLRVRKCARLAALLGAFGALVYFIAPSAALRVGVCKDHWSVEEAGRLLPRVFLCFSGAVLLFLLVLGREPEAVLGAFVLLVLCLNLAIIAEIMRPKLLRAVNADRHYLWIENVSPEMLAQLPEIPSS